MKIELIRKQKGYSRRELSLLSGVSQKEIYKIEKGLIPPQAIKLGTYILLAKALKTKVVDLIKDYI